MAQASAIVLFGVSILLGAFFLSGALVPRQFIALARRFMTGPGIAGAVGVRLLLAFLLWFSAPVATTPAAFRAVSVVVFVAALLIPFLGAAAIVRLIDRIACWPPIAVRMLLSLGLAFSVFVLWSVSPAVGMF